MRRQPLGAAEGLLARAPASVRARNKHLAPLVDSAPPAVRPARHSPAASLVAARAPRKAPQRTAAPVAALPTGAVVVTIDGLKLASEANARGHTKHGKSSRAAAVRAAVARALAGRALPPLPVRVCVTRVAPRRIDTDNLASACKSARDQVAAALEVDDGPGETRVTWRESQVVGPSRVRVTLTPLDGRASVVVGEAADVVTVAVTGTQWADAMRTMLDRDGGWARFDVAGLSLRLVLTRADL